MDRGRALTFDDAGGRAIPTDLPLRCSKARLCKRRYTNRILSCVTLQLQRPRRTEASTDREDKRKSSALIVLEVERI